MRYAVIHPSIVTVGNGVLNGRFSLVIELSDGSKHGSWSEAIAHKKAHARRIPVDIYGCELRAEN